MAEVKYSLCDLQTCTGCMACKQKCKFGAISIREVNGFSYPDIDESRCKHCGLCVKVCPILTPSDRSGVKLGSTGKCLAMWNKDSSIRMKSSSGGVFSILASYVLKLGGVVFGAAWNDNMVLEHKAVTSMDELDVLRKSKYVQSDTKNTFGEVLDYLKRNKLVLYCGTPCQIAGLDSFLSHKEYDNLLMVDVLCQGVPSPWAFKKYITEVEAEKGVKITDANFRSKLHGWRCGLMLLLRSERNGQSFSRSCNNNEYYNAFIKEYFMRESCYNCQFKNHSQGYYSDLTIADFWRIGDLIPFHVQKYEQGISAVLVNTPKGEKILDVCKGQYEMLERDFSEFATNGGIYNSRKPQNNNEAFDFLKTHSWRQTQDKYFPLSLKQILKIKLHLLLGGQRIRMIRKMMGKTK